MTRATILLLGVMIALGAINGRAQTRAAVGTTGTQGPTAAATFIDAERRTIGQARLQQTPHGVLLKIELTNATPGIHALHLHMVGKCDAPSFESAGDHVGTAAHKHGFLNPAGPHAGDLPNLDVPASTKLSVEYLVANVTLSPGSRSLLDADGSALVMHTDKDDYATDPAGGSGDRLACAAIAADPR